VTVLLPVAIGDAPRHASLCFHPSLLPKFRGGSAIPWQIILGETESGVTVFRPDEGVDTGPIVVQKGPVPISDRDNAASLYYDKLYPLGVEAMLEAADAVASGTATYDAQDESRASHQGLLKDLTARIDWKKPARELDRLVRGCDPSPGAHARWGERVVRLHRAHLAEEDDPGAPPGSVLAVDEGGMRVALDGGTLAVERVRVDDGKKVAAAESGLAAGERLS